MGWAAGRTDVVSVMPGWATRLPLAVRGKAISADEPLRAPLYASVT